MTADGLPQAADERRRWTEQPHPCISLPMIPDREIWQAANLMIKRIGADAGTQAAMRADELLDAGDVEGAATWRAILRAIDQVQAIRPAAVVH